MGTQGGIDPQDKIIKIKNQWRSEMKKRVSLVCTLLFLAGGLVAQQTTSEIYGTVVLPDGSAIPGVAVTLTGDMLGAKTAVSSEEGNFRFVRLLPGNYELKLELDGFKTVIRKGLRLYAGRPITLTISMETTTIKEEVVVTGKANVVDTRRTSVGMNISKEALQSLPSARNPWAIISMAPGVMNDVPEVGGSDSAQQSHPQQGGSRYSDTVWSVDGIDNSSMVTAGTSTGYLDVNNYEELQVTTSAMDVTSMTGGTQINFVSKRGGNKIGGDFHLYVESKDWEMKHAAPEAPPIEKYVTPGVNSLYQYGVSLGGPIKKDKLWFFGAWSMQDIRARALNNEESAAMLTNGYIKLNAQFGNTLAEFHLSYDKKFNNAYKPSQSWDAAQVTADAMRVQKMPNYYWYGTVEQVLGNLMLTAKVGIIRQDCDFNPNGSEYDPVTGHEVGNELYRYSSRNYIRQSGSANYWYSVYDQQNAQLEGNLFVEKLLNGDHELRFGVEYNNIDTVSHTLSPNQRVGYFKWYGDFTSSYGLWLRADNEINAGLTRTSAYLSDTATFKRLTVNLGLRYDSQAPRINEYTMPGFTWRDTQDPAHDGIAMYPEWLGPLTVKKFNAPDYTAFSPRFSLSYDITGDGKNVVKFSAARYGSRFGISDGIWPLLPNEGGFREIDIYWYDDGDGIPTYSELAYGGYDYYYYANYCTSIDYETGRMNARFAPGYNTPLLDELTLSFEKQLADNLAVSLTGFYKKQHNDIRLIGIMEDGTEETKANWYEAGTEMVNGKEVTYWDRHEVPVGTYFTNYKKNYNRYTGLQLAMTKKFSDKWMADASFIYQDWKDFRFAEETFDMTNFNYWNGAPYWPREVRGSPDVYMNSRWQFKLAGLYQLPWNINVSVAFMAQEGYVLAKYIESANRQNGLGYFPIYEPDKKFGDERLPAFWTLNLGLEKNFKIGSDGKTIATVFVDAYNLTNNDTVIGKGAVFESDTFGKVTRMLNPGLFQFGFRVKF
jgi:hypothetical protein